MPIGPGVQFGGQTAINLAAHLEKLGVPILGTPAWSIDAAEDREKFDVILEKCGIPRPAGHTVMTEEEAVKAADELGSVSYTHLDVYKRQVQVQQLVVILVIILMVMI